MAIRRGIDYLSTKEIRDLINYIDSKRDKLIVRILFETGCTVNELVNIQIKDIDFNQKLIYFPPEITKSTRPKKSLISDSLASFIKSYIVSSLRSRSNAAYIEKKYLFSTRQSQAMTTKRIRQILQFYGQALHFPKKLNPHVLRYSHIAHALDSGISLKSIQKQIGIEKFRLMQIYDLIMPDKDDYNKFFRT